MSWCFWALALETGPKDPDRDRTSCPIFADQSKSAGSQQGLERYLPVGAIDVIEDVQPFRTRNASLSVLRTLSNQDMQWIPHLDCDWRARPWGPIRGCRIEAIESPTRRSGVLLHKVLLHVSVDVLPEFEPLFS